MADETQGVERKTVISPMLSVRKGARAVDFYRAEGSEFWVADESPEFEFQS